MENNKGRLVSFRNAEQFFNFVQVNQITEIFVHPAKRERYGDRFDGQDIFEGANSEKNLLVRFDSKTVIPQRQGTEINSKGQVVEEFKNKKELLEGLREYGAPTELLAKLQITKASELKEFLDTTKTESQDNADVDSKSVNTTVTKPRVSEAIKHDLFKLLDITYNGDNYRVVLTLKTTPGDVSKQLRSKFKESKIAVFDAKLTLWAFNQSDD